jgi:hypothetical protein
MLSAFLGCPSLLSKNRDYTHNSPAQRLQLWALLSHPIPLMTPPSAVAKRPRVIVPRQTAGVEDWESVVSLMLWHYAVYRPHRRDC